MDNQLTELTERFAALADDELLRRCESHDLTPQAARVAHQELQRRGLTPSPSRPTTLASFANGEDLATVVTLFDPVEAYIVQGCLKASGVAAQVADVNLIQTYALLTPALGGVRILVPASHLEQAQAVVAAYQRGDFALNEDVDVGEA